MSAAPRVLIADSTPATHSTLESLLRRAGWTVLTVVSSGEVLRAVRDHAVDVLLIDPELPGAGVSGIDVVRTLKGATRFRHLPVLLLLRGGRTVTIDVPCEGSLALDRLSEAEIRQAILSALVHGAVPDIVREIAAKVVPEIAERLIREEMGRLRFEHGLGGSR
ncbi:MAG: response regulator [Candidatus Rokubacteria bacterium]|nr:response regulator [Candidatus Rokubacteria bacterium]